MTESRGPLRIRSGAGRLIVLSGPSGVGKDTVLRALFAMAPSLRYSVSYTTRTPRDGEREDVSYSFIDEETFRRMARAREFLEYAEVHGALYGTSVARVQEAIDRGDDIVLKIDVKGAAYVRRRAPEALLIFLEPPSPEELRHRLESRETEDSESLARRHADAVAELAEAPRYDHRVVNDDVHRAAREILAILERRRAVTTSGTPRDV
jgi:guanylate kinase